MKIQQKNSNNINESQFLAKCFKYFDIQNKGKVDFDQFFRAMDKLGIIMDRDDIYAVFKQYDVDNNNFVEYKEFSQVFLEGKKQDSQGVAEDPYIREKQRREQESANVKKDSPENLFLFFREKLKGRGPRGFIGIRRLFNMLDDDKSGQLTLQEFGKACKDFKIGVSEENIPNLFKYFDADKNGMIDYNEFMTLLLGKLSP